MATRDLGLGTVGPRLRALRQERDLTLAALAEVTGISVSTLSRLESGQRRPTLELLLPVARTFGVPLDALVDPPDDDPRVRLRPIVRHGMTYLPLTRRQGGLQAFKLVLPPGAPREDLGPGSHEGYEWLYVLSGRVRLVLGDHDLVLGAGEAAEFDTHVPHRLSNPGPATAEVLTLFGPQGERMHVRAQPRRS